MCQIVVADIFKTALNKVVAHTACHFKQKKNDRNRLHVIVRTPVRLT